MRCALCDRSERKPLGPPPTDFAGLEGNATSIIICVPTPLTRHREPDLTYITRTCERHRPPPSAPASSIVARIHHLPRHHKRRPVSAPSSRRTGLQAPATDFFLGYLARTRRPRQPQPSTTADHPQGRRRRRPRLQLRTGLQAFYDQIVPSSNPSSRSRPLATAEAVKLTENIFRAVNIALVNELKVIYEAMGIDIWEVIEAAKTKPFGYMPFYPGPGLGGHCIPIDPFYLTWKAREFGVATRFVELAGEINTAMPRRVAARTVEAMNQHDGRAAKGARILILGVAYKRNVDDTRESPSFHIMELLERQGAEVMFHDPHVAEIGATREHPEFAGRRSTGLSEALLATIDATVICTDHDAVDYRDVARWSRLVIDTRNVCARHGLVGEHIVKA